MALNENVKVPLPETGILVRKTGIHNTYVFKVLRTYRNEKGQPTNDRISIGKLDIETGMLIPNNNYYKYYSNEEVISTPAYKSIRSVGCSFVVNQIFKKLELNKMLEDIFGENRASKLITICNYMISRGNVLEYINDFSEEYLFNEAFLTSQECSVLFASISYEERMEFFKQWIKKRNELECLAYDVTSISSYSRNILETEWGYNRDNEELPQINLACFLDNKSGYPIFYTTYNGSIIDKTHLKYMMMYNEELDIKHATYIMDKGFCTAENVKYLLKSDMSFVLSTDIRYVAIKKAIDQVRLTIREEENRIVDTIFTAQTKSPEFNCTAHIYFDYNLETEQNNALYNKIDEIKSLIGSKKILSEAEIKKVSCFYDVNLLEDSTFEYIKNKDKINLALKCHGYFVILSNTNFNSEKVLSIYRKRDMIEKSFDDLKNYLDMKGLRVHNSETMNGKIFASFLSLIFITYLGNKLKKFMKDHSMSKADIIKELEKIKIVDLYDNARLINPFTKIQRDILYHLDIDEKCFNLYLNQ